MGPGFFGKLRSHGDFVGRRLPPAMRLAFDTWLQRGLVQSRQDLGAAWLPTWLSSPLWRFVLAPGVCGPQAWAGVMMPSCDRVGRCFPLVLASSLERAPPLLACMALHAPWFMRLEELALSSLEDGFSLVVFDAALMAFEGAPAAPERDAGVPFEPPPGAAWVAAFAASVPPALAGVHLARRSAWWTDGSPRVAPCLAVCNGLPAPAAFASLLDGAWHERGWGSA